jgi:DNA-binding CsgD family transcriptional regulator
VENNLALSNTEERILNLLGQGIAAENVASALGITPARVSQLLSNKNFAEKVTELRYNNLQKHNARDSSYDEIEDELIVKLKKALPLMFRPETILKSIQVINGAKRRGQSAPEQIVNQNTVVNLVLPTQITQKFTTNINNQVIKAGDQELITIKSDSLLNQLHKQEDSRETEKATKELTYENSKTDGEANSNSS